MGQAMDILDQEADEDEALRDSAGAIPERAPSLEANRDLVAKEQQYRTVLEQATDSDALVRKKWEEWEDSVTQLTWPEVRRAPEPCAWFFALTRAFLVFCRTNWSCRFRLRRSTSPGALAL